jgi:hypothetical protein
MATNLMAQLTNDLRGDTLERIATAVGKDPVMSAAALDRAAPALVAAVSVKGSTSSGAATTRRRNQRIDINVTEK